MKFYYNKKIRFGNGDGGDGDEYEKLTYFKKQREQKKKTLLQNQHVSKIII